MEKHAFVEMLVSLHDSLDRVVDALTPDRPDLARALRKRAAWIPTPEQIARGGTGPGSRTASLGPLLYQALAEGAVDGREFDRLMIRQDRAAREVKKATR